MIGFEKTFLDRRVSIGLRQPFFQIHSLDTGPNRYSASGADDLNIILKYAPLHRESGSVLSFGLVTTVPTSSKGLSTSELVLPTKASESAPFVKFIDELHTPLFQPFIGYIWTRRDLF